MVASKNANTLGLHLLKGSQLLRSSGTRFDKQDGGNERNWWGVDR